MPRSIEFVCDALVSRIKIAMMETWRARFYPTQPANVALCDADQFQAYALAAWGALPIEGRGAMIGYLRTLGAPYWTLPEDRADRQAADVLDAFRHIETVL